MLKTVFITRFTITKAVAALIAIIRAIKSAFLNPKVLNPKKNNKKRVVSNTMDWLKKSKNHPNRSNQVNAEKSIVFIVANNCIEPF